MRIPLPNNIEKNGEYFWFKVQGDSMIEAGINDGDTVIVKTDTAENGKIVVALIDDNEAMLKELEEKEKLLHLKVQIEITKQKYLAQIELKVQGILVSLYRNFQ